MHAHYIATPQEDLDKYENALNLAATLVSSIQGNYLRIKPVNESSLGNIDPDENISDDEDFENLKVALLELGYEIK